MTHTVAPAFKHCSGPRDAKIALVGEAWGEQEEMCGMPFMGSSGQELTRMLKEAGIERRDCFLTNVLALRPQNNDMESVCGKKDCVGEGYAFPPLSQGKYLRPEFLPELSRLREELRTVRPNIVVALGATASWALLQNPKIGSIRGAVAQDSNGFKVLPTYHPAGVMRNWSWRTIVIADFLKAKRHSVDKQFFRPRRRILVNPTLKEVWDWVKQALSVGQFLGVDIETTAGQVDRVGFAYSKSEAISIPFLDQSQTGWNYWPTQADEVEAWKAVKTLCTSALPKVFQNGLFDLQYLWRLGIKVVNCSEDTMILHHAIFPEMQKGLGFLGSIYTDEPAWKLMRKEHESMKRDD